MKLRTLLMALGMLLLFVGCQANEGAATMDEHDGHNMSEDGEMDAEDMQEMGMDVPEGLDVSTDKMTDGGMFHAKVEPLVDTVVINELHTWQLTLMDIDKNPVEGAAITFGGGMPEHNHGFPTEPEIVAGDEAGVYLIEGVKMQMAGFWEMKLDIEAGGMSDAVTFNIVLP